MKPAETPSPPPPDSAVEHRAGALATPHSEDLQEEPENPVEVDKDDNQNDSQAEQPHLTPPGTGQDK